MRALREHRLRRAWRQLEREPLRQPEGPQRWGADARVLVLFDRDDAGQSRAAHALTLADFGIGGRGRERPPSLLGYASAPEPDATVASGTWTPKQLAYAGMARADVAEGVLAKAYDLIVNLVPRAFPPFDFLCAAARAHLRAASHDEAMHAYDIVIRPRASTTASRPAPSSAGASATAAFLQELRAYLGALNPHDHG